MPVLAPAVREKPGAACSSPTHFGAAMLSVFRIASSTVQNVVTYPVMVRADNPEEKLFPGMTANITVISDTHTNVLLVPKSAAIKNNNGYFVIVDNGNSQRETRQVAVGLRDDKNIEIISGLKLGEEILAY